MIKRATVVIEREGQRKLERLEHQRRQIEHEERLRIEEERRKEEETKRAEYERQRNLSNKCLVQSSCLLSDI